MRLDGVNEDGVSGWDLHLDKGKLSRREWHCDYSGTGDREAYLADIEELLNDSYQEWPKSLPHEHFRTPEKWGTYRDENAMLEWRKWLLALCADDPPKWFVPEHADEEEL